MAATVTFVAISDMSPIDPVGRDVILLLIANMVVIGMLGWIVVRRYIATRSENGGAGGKLARRFLLLFGLSAMIPAVIVSLFLGAAITRGLDTWFGERIVTLVAETAAVARENVDEFSNVFEEDARLMALDVNNAVSGITSDPDRFESYLGIQAYVRNMPAAYVVDETGEPIAVAENVADGDYFRRPSVETIAEADAGRVVLSLEEPQGFATAVIKLQDAEAYLYIAKPLDVSAFTRLRRAEQALAEYRAAGQISARLRWLFVVAYGQIVILVLLMSIRLAFEAAGRITGPIGRLANAAQAVREGDLDIRVELPESADEVGQQGAANGLCEAHDCTPV